MYKTFIKSPISPLLNRTEVPLEYFSFKFLTGRIPKLNIMIKKITSPIVVLFAILLLPSWMVAQTTIKGTVTDALSGMPLGFASVNVKGTNTTTLTNTEGVFTITLSGENQKLEVSFVGFITQTVEAVNNVSIKLVPDDSRLNEVVVSGLATSIKRSNSANA